jgi:hypothetical protein
MVRRFEQEAISPLNSSVGSRYELANDGVAFGLRIQLGGDDRRRAATGRLIEEHFRDGQDAIDSRAPGRGMTVNVPPLGGIHIRPVVGEGQLRAPAGVFAGRRRDVDPKQAGTVLGRASSRPVALLATPLAANHGPGTDAPYTQKLARRVATSPGRGPGCPLVEHLADDHSTNILRLVCGKFF